MGILMYKVPCEVSISANVRHVVSADSASSWLNGRVPARMRFLHLPVGKVVAKTGSSLIRLLPTTAFPAEVTNPSGRFGSLASCRVAWKTTRSLPQTPLIEATAPLPFDCVEDTEYSISSVIGFMRSAKDHLSPVLAAYSGPFCFASSIFAGAISQPFQLRPVSLVPHYASPAPPRPALPVPPLALLLPPLWRALRGRRALQDFPITPSVVYPTRSRFGARRCCVDIP